jgi:hypothetical protein
MALHKDLALDRLAELGNIAQFVAYRPGRSGLEQSTSRVIGFAPNAKFPSLEEAVAALLERSDAGAVNIRTYEPESPRSRDFLYDKRSVGEVLENVHRLAADGLHLIINETVDVHDGGISGVVQGDTIEFAPDATPRIVEQPDVASLPRSLGLAILKRVYGFVPDLPDDQDARVEFSIHPALRGWRKTHTLLWEIEAMDGACFAPAPAWPNRFSRHIGDKCFGLLVADYLGAPVPRTFVIPRRIAPFSFGQDTGSRETWIRTCPTEPQPGLFTTAKGWLDPFALLAAEDPGEARQIASVLSQAAISARYSGAAIVGADGKLFIEGATGEGDAFMLGTQHAESLPAEILADVARLHENLTGALGPVRIEWVHDGEQVWVVQLHVGATGSTATTLVAGDADQWHEFDVTNGLNSLREFLADLPDDTGVILRGDVGLTSHVADVVRKRGLPARIDRG